MIDHFECHIPLVLNGLGVLRNHYASGRMAASVASHGGITGISYFGQQFHKKSPFFKAPEVGGFVKLARVQVLIDDESYFLEFRNTHHLPFGYRSECELNGVQLSHELILDQAVLFQRIRVLSNPSGRKIRARLLMHNTAACAIEGRTQAPWQIDGNGCLHCVVTDVTDGQQADTAIIFGANKTLKSCARDEKFIYVQEFAEESSELIFYIGFNVKVAPEDCSLRMNRQISDYERCLFEGLRFDTGCPVVDSALNNAVPTVLALAVPDRPGAIKASQSYWIWGWDSMVHAEALIWGGHANLVRDMIDFYRETAHPEKGVLHAFKSDFSLWYDMAPSAQSLYVVMLYNYFAATGDRDTLERCLPFAQEILEKAGAAKSRHNSLSTGLGYYPDRPQCLGQEEGDISLINNSLYLQALRAMQELAGTCDKHPQAVQADMERVLWDEEQGYWVDSASDKDLRQRNYYPIFGQLYVSPFGADPKMDQLTRTGAFLRRHYRFERGLYMYPPAMPGFMADGNQLGAYYPPVDRYYWNVMNRCGESKAVEEFERIVADFWQEHTFPEGLTHETVNAEPATDNPGTKQAFTAKVWCCDAIELNLGLRVFINGFALKPLANNKPFRIYNMVLRGKRIDIERTGSGSASTMALNGESIEGGWISWEQLSVHNHICIKMIDQ